MSTKPTPTPRSADAGRPHANDSQDPRAAARRTGGHHEASTTRGRQDSCRRALDPLATDGAPMAAWLRGHLFGHVLPFWERFGFDERGGLLTCLSDEGEVLSTDKWLWSQWRAVWVFSHLHLHFGRDARWLQRARHIADFCVRYGWDSRSESWALVVAQDGRILRGHESIYTDVFAVYGLTELHAATGEEQWLHLACRTADAALQKLAQPPDRIAHFPYPIPGGSKPHGIPLQWSFVLGELAAVSGVERYRRAAGTMADEIFRDFLRPDRDVLLERVALDGTELPAPVGTVVVPGHGIECLWFQAHLDPLLGRDRQGRIFPLILRHLALGWDEEQGGGIRLAIDADGGKAVDWGFPDTKPWWPLTEAWYATLLGWNQTRRPEFLTWYRKLWDLSLDHYVDEENGEWRQKLDRSFSRLSDVIALPVKDPFHLPRSLMLQIQLLEGGFSSVIPGSNRR